MSSPAQDFANSLVAELKLTEGLLTLLQEERVALEQFDHEKLDTISAQKHEALVQLERWEESRDQAAYGLAGIEEKPTEMGEIIALLPKDMQTPALKLWGKLKTTAQECAQANQVNGRILALSKRSVDRGLKILHGQTSTNQTVYDQKGAAQEITAIDRYIKA